MKIAGVKEVKQELSRFLDGLDKDLVVITKKGRPYAGMVRLTNENDLEAFLVANNTRLMELLDQSDAKGGETPLEEVEARVRRAERKHKRGVLRAA